MTATGQRRSYSNLPGADLVAVGVEGLVSGTETPEAMLVAMAAPRLRAVGVEVPDVRVDTPSHRLYDLLAAEHPDSAHARYNALVQRIVSFARAAEHARSS